MSNSADTALSLRNIRNTLGPNFSGASDDSITALSDEAAILASEEHMPYKTALAIVSGQSRNPYGSPRR